MYRQVRRPSGQRFSRWRGCPRWRGAVGSAIGRARLNDPDPGASLVGIFDDRRSRVPTKMGNVSVHRGVADLLAMINKEDIDVLIVADKPAA